MDGEAKGFLLSLVCMGLVVFLCFRNCKALSETPVIRRTYYDRIYVKEPQTNLCFLYLETWGFHHPEDSTKQNFYCSQFDESILVPCDSLSRVKVFNLFPDNHYDIVSYRERKRNEAKH